MKWYNFVLLSTLCVLLCINVYLQNDKLSTGYYTSPVVQHRILGDVFERSTDCSGVEKYYSGRDMQVDVVAFELTDTRDDITADPFPVIFDNAIGFNDFRGTEVQIAITPAELADYNVISRNLGDNRGHGLHPKLFGPGGN